MLEQMDYEKFRQQLAGLQSTDAAEFDGEAFKRLGVQLGVVMAQLFGDSLDRLTLWQRISDGIRSSAAKVGDADTDHFLSLCLDFIKSEDSKVAANENFLALIQELNSQDEGFRRQWIRYLSSRVYAVVTHARAQWEMAKGFNAAVKAGTINEHTSQPVRAA